MEKQNFYNCIYLLVLSFFMCLSFYVNAQDDKKPPIIFTKPSPSKSTTSTASTSKKTAIVFYNLNKLIENYVEDKVNDWQRKDEFESSAEYNLRMSDRKKKVSNWTTEAIDVYKKKQIEKVDFTDYSLSVYDADRETFKIKINLLGEFVLKVPRVNDEARNFKENQNSLRFEKTDLVIQNNKWLLSYIEVITQSGNRYIYDIRKQHNHDPLEQFAFKFEPINISINDDIGGVETADDYNIEQQLPATEMTNPNAIAILIGNKDYDKTDNVNFARNDVVTMRRYLQEVLGYKRANIFVTENARKSDFELYFGTGDDDGHKGKLFNTVREDGSSDVFIYYSGHGAPSLKDGAGYFIPVECDPSYIDIQGYPTELLYRNLAKVPAKSINVVIDACFSGSVHKNISPIGLKVRDDIIKDPRTVVITSSKTNQASSWYNSKQHGLFTFFFLKAIHNYKSSDVNNDGALTMQEIYDYITNGDGVTYFARRIHGIEQHPTLKGKDKDRVLIKLKK